MTIHLGIASFSITIVTHYRPRSLVYWYVFTQLLNIDIFLYFTSPLNRYFPVAVAEKKHVNYLTQFTGFLI